MLRATRIVVSIVHNQNRISERRDSASETIEHHSNLTCKLLGLAGETEHPLSFVDETLPDGLICAASSDRPIVSTLFFRRLSPVLIEDVDGLSS